MPTVMYPSALVLSLSTSLSHYATCDKVFAMMLAHIISPYSLLLCCAGIIFCDVIDENDKQVGVLILHARPHVRTRYLVIAQLIE